MIPTSKTYKHIVIFVISDDSEQKTYKIIVIFVIFISSEPKNIQKHCFFLKEAHGTYHIAHMSSYENTSAPYASRSFENTFWPFQKKEKSQNEF